MSENQSVRYLKGVGEKRAAMYLKLGVETVGDLLRYFPRDYIDLSKVYSLSEAPRGEKCAIRAEVTAKSAEMRIRKGLSVFKVTATDGERDMVITYFNTKYTVQGLKIGEEYIFYGTVTGSFVAPEMSSPMVIKSENINKFIPIYGLTAGLTSKAIAANVRTAVDIMSGNIKDYLDEKIKDRYSLCGLEKAIINIHFPENREILKEAKSRIVFDEALQTCIGLAMMRKKNEGVTGVSMQKKDLEPFCKALPFKMTSAQIRAVREITDDMCKSVPMNRLLQGDVGSGKTAVCAAAAYFAYLNGKQTALMAPTELLARQHYDTLKKMLEFSGMRIELITGSIKAKEKRAAYERAENCESDLVVGTHALIEDKLRFGALGLVVTDEMHRFGVAQRAKLDNKDGNPHMLVMSATPIPRTLAYVSYGDLDISELNELPGGRIPVKTYLVDGSKRKRAYDFIKRFLDENRKGYIICPLVEDDEENESGLFNVEEYAENIKNEEFKGYGVGILHGKMKPSEKEEVMREFKYGELDLLVATTVIEVGIDVPEANVILIENAERFGMSQLHQLRGRVGRGKEQAYCILVSDSKNDLTQERLKTVASTTDGFELAKKDLEMRGPGDFFGYRQHGTSEENYNIQQNSEILGKAREAAEIILSGDPGLEKKENEKLRERAIKICEFVLK